MILDEKPFETLSKEDMLRLISEKVRELRAVEYKSQLPGHSDADKKEFLADISSFANAQGGYLLYGVEEVGGEPARLSGVDLPDPDAEIRRLEIMVQAGVSPRLLVHSLPVELEGGRFVLVLKIPKSWVGPHIVTFQDWSRFYSRTSAGKFLLKVDELGRAFLERSSVRDHIRRFRMERLAAVASGDVPHELRKGPKMVIHMVPHGSVEQGFGAGSLEIQRTRDLAVPPHAGRMTDDSMNLDGMVTWRAQTAYVQVFRDGSVEAVAVLPRWGEEGEQFYIDGTEKEREIPHIIGRYLGIPKRLFISGPVTIMLSYLGIRGCALRTGPQDFTPRTNRNDIILPEITVDESTTDLAQSLKPALDAVWNAFGMLLSYNYDRDTGVWIE